MSGRNTWAIDSPNLPRSSQEHPNLPPSNQGHPPMPQSYPPYSTQRHTQHDIERNPKQRSRESSRVRDQRTRNRPYAETHERSRGYQRWKVLQGHLVATSGEFVGTVLFLWFAFAGTQAAAMISPNGVMDPSRLMFISLSFGMSLAVVVWAFYRISGGLFNPAVTLALVVTGNLPWVRGLVVFPAQVLGGIVAAALVSCMLPGPIAVVVSLAENTSVAQGVFIEAFLTALLVFVILMLAAEKHAATPVAPVGIGLALFVCELAGVLFTGGSLNPARAFGPAVVSRSFEHYHYIYWFGPVIGALVASAYYKFVKHFDYEEANPGQDARSEK